MESDKYALLIQKLTTQMPEIWVVLLKQAKMHAQASMVMCTCLLGAIVALVLIGKSQAKKAKEPGYCIDQADSEMCSMICYAGATVFALFTGVIVYIDIFIPLVNPEFWALKQILK